jgi:hypothetical protein
VARVREPINPFYALLVVSGTAFTVTVFALVAMMVREERPDAAAATGLMGLVAKHGVTVLAVEIAVVAVGAIGAIVVDDRRLRRAAAAEDERRMAKRTEEAAATAAPAETIATGAEE